MMSKFYQFVGVSRNEFGQLAVRYASNAGRARALERVGHTEVMFIDLGQPEHVEEAVHALMDYVEDNERIDLLEVVRNEAERVGFVV
jgi:hypothetical protein